MAELTAILASVLEKYPAYETEQIAGLLETALKGLDKKIIVLDDDPTGSQTVHDIFVYTDWEEETLTAAFEDVRNMFFVLTNSRGMTTVQTEAVHKEIARNIVRAAEKTGKDYIIISRSDSTLRGHYPLETLTLKTEIEALTGKPFDGEIIYPFFREGGRFTIGDVHYVREGDMLVPAGQTEFAKDKSFGYRASNMPEWCMEKSGGMYKAEDVTCISLDDLRRADVEKITEQLCNVTDFNKVIVNSVDYTDVKVFTAAFCQALKRGKRFMFRSAAAIVKVLGGVPDRALLTKDELVEPDDQNGGIVLVGSHVHKTTQQLETLKQSACPIEFIEFNQHLVLEEGGLEREVKRVIALAEEKISAGITAAIYTRRDRFDLDTTDKDKQLEVSVRISDAVTSIVGKLTVKPSFIVAKGGITSSDVGTKALRIKKAEIMGQIRPGIPVWKTGAESKFPYMPYVVFPGNVGSVDDLKTVVEALIGAK